MLSGGPASIYALLAQYFYPLLLTLLLTYILYQRFVSPLAKFPGPFLASLTRWWLVAEIRKERFHLTIQSLHAQYGPVVRIGPDELSLADPQAFRQIYGAGAHFSKSDWYSVWQGPRKFDLFGGRDEKIHGQQRKMVARAYTMETLKDLEPYVDKCTEELHGKIGESMGTTIDLGTWLQLWAFDVISEITWSTSFGFLANGSSSGTFENIRTMARSAQWLGHVPYVYRFHELLKPYIGNWLGVNIRHGFLREFAVRETAKRRENPGGKRDIVSRLFETNQQKPDEFTYEGVVSMAISNITAGSDTTAASLQAMVYNLLKNPDTKARLVDEIDDLRRRGELSNPVTYEEACKMKYLQAVIYEGLRVFPAIGINLPRKVPPAGMEISGHYVPGGYTVGMNGRVLHHNKEIFGQDADQFSPERWLKEDTGDMQRYSFSFGGGSRKCIGRNVAWLEMSKLLPTLFLNYDMELVEPCERKEVCLFAVLQTGLNVKLKPRRDLAAAE